MGKTYTDFSQLSKGMFKKSDPVVEVKPLPPKKAAGDDALAYFGLNAPEAPTRAPGVAADNGRIPISKTPSDRRGAQNTATDIANRCF